MAEKPTTIIDLTLPLDASTPVYRDPRGYADPPTRVTTWIDVGQRATGFISPFRVSRLQVGLHTGTHVDAPSHFHPGATTLDSLRPTSLIGRALVIDLAAMEDEAAALLAVERARSTARPDSLPLVITAPRGLGAESTRLLAGWGRDLILFAGPLDDDPDCPRASSLLAAGVFLVVDLDAEAARAVSDGDLLVVAPLALRGVEAAPCRVFAIRGSAV